MRGATHAILGLTTYSAAINAGLLPVVPRTWGELAAAGAIAATFALLPDIDHRQSTIGRRSGLVSSIVSRCSGHRGMTHSLAAAALLAFLLSVVDPVWRVAALCGYLSHLLGDAVTGRVPLLWPVPLRIGIRLFRGGSRMDHIVGLLCTAGTGIVLSEFVARLRLM